MTTTAAPDAVSFAVSGTAVYGDHITVRIGSASGLHEIAVHETGSGTPLGAYTVTPSVPATTAVIPLSPVPHSTSLTITITALGSTPGALDTITFYLPRDTTVPTNIASNVCTGGGYRYGYNTQIKENEIAGVCNHYSALYWEYDPRVARRWNVDPVYKPSQSIYLVFDNSPISINDPNGDCTDCPLRDPSGNKYASTTSGYEMEDFQVKAERSPDKTANPETNASGGLFGGNGEYNIWEAAARDIGRNDENRVKVDNINKGVMAWMGIGASPMLAIAGAEGGGAWVLNNLLTNGGKFVGFNAAGGAGDLTYQLATKDLKDVNLVSVGANTFFGPLPSAAVGYTFNLSYNSVVGTTELITNPFNVKGLFSIGVGTAGNWGGGALGAKLGIPTIRIGTVNVPNIFGPTLDMGANAAGNAASDVVTSSVYPPDKKKQ